MFQSSNTDGIAPLPPLMVYSNRRQLKKMHSCCAQSTVLMSYVLTLQAFVGSTFFPGNWAGDREALSFLYGSLCTRRNEKNISIQI